MNKPIYKRWWFWILAILVIVGIRSAAGKDTTKATNERTAPQVEAEAPTQTPQSSELLRLIDTAEQTPSPTPTPDPLSDMTMEQRNAYKSALGYFSWAGWSREGIIHQLEYEGYSHEAAEFAVDYIDPDYKEQAVISARSYINSSSFSYSGLVHQLEYEGFTTSQAVYGADRCNANWNEEAAESAASYLSHSAFSRDGLINQLLYEGFTQEQAEYGVTQAGY